MKVSNLLLWIFLITIFKNGICFALISDELVFDFLSFSGMPIENKNAIIPTSEDWIEIESQQVSDLIFEKAQLKINREIQKLTDHFETSQVRLKWAEYTRWNRDAFETAYKAYQDTLDKAQDEGFKNNRYKIYLGGALAFIPIGWGVTHALLFLPASWSTLLGGSIVYFFRGEVFVQRFKDKSRKLFGSLKHISEEIYQEQKLCNDTNDFNGQQMILEEMQKISLYFDDELILQSLKTLSYLIKKSEQNLSEKQRDQLILELFIKGAQLHLEKKVARIYHSFGADYTIPPEKNQINRAQLLCDGSSCTRDVLENKRQAAIAWEKFFWVHWLQTISENGSNERNIKNFLNKFIINRFADLWDEDSILAKDPVDIYQNIVAEPISISFPVFSLK